jgi:prophage regulatory protein
MRYLNTSQLRKKLGDRARSTIYVDVAAGRLPAPIKLGGRLYWIESDVDARLLASADEYRDCSTATKTEAT